MTLTLWHHLMLMYRTVKTYPAGTAKKAMCQLNTWPDLPANWHRA